MYDLPKAVMLRDLPELTKDLIAIAKGVAVVSRTTANSTVDTLGLQAQTLLERHGLWEKREGRQASPESNGHLG